jgi:hypothetical protein
MHDTITLYRPTGNAEPAVAEACGTGFATHFKARKAFMDQYAIHHVGAARQASGGCRQRS